MNHHAVCRLAILGISILSLAGCTNKRDKARIKELETDMSTLQEESSVSLAEREKELSAKDEALRNLQSETAEKIQSLTTERDNLTAELATMKRNFERAEAARIASQPKDASSPGHADYDPAKEPKITNAVASISGDKTSGSGFIVSVDSKLYLYTAAHVISGNTRLTITNAAGTKFTKFDNIEVAEGADIVRLELLDGGDVPSLKIAAATAKTGSDTDITALGISGAAGSVAGERAKAIGQKADIIDVDAVVLQGKSGGPLLETTSGKVLAVIVAQSEDRNDPRIAAAAAAAGSSAALGSITPDSTCRAIRLNREITWKAIPVAAYLAEAKKIVEFDRLTRVGLALAPLSPAPNGLVGLNLALDIGQTPLQILTDAKDIPVAGEVLAMHASLAAKRARTSDVDLKKRYASLVSSVVSLMQRSDATFDPAKFCAYHRRFATVALDARTKIEKKLKGSAGE